LAKVILNLIKYIGWKESCFNSIHFFKKIDVARRDQATSWSTRCLHEGDGSDSYHTIYVRHFLRQRSVASGRSICRKPAAPEGQPTAAGAENTMVSRFCKGPARQLADCSSSQRSNNSWRLSQEALATQTNRKARKPEREATCQVCGREDESGYHAVVRCPQAAALHDAMREHWMLPEENMFSYSGPEWLLHLLGTVRPEERNNALLVLWRA
jgi:hypothetical protein